MLVLLSPAKTLDYETPLTTQAHTLPEFVDQARPLIERLETFAPQDIADLMKLSDKLALLNVARYQSWTTEHNFHNARQALLAFKGDVYTGLDAESLSESDLEFAQQHLRILSGLYGLLKPLDLMQPYRLEMGTSLETDKGKTLYAYWGSTITDRLNTELAPSDVVVNLASTEYFKSVQPKKLNARLITPVFKDEKNGQYKIISFWAKRARGLMARYIIDKRVSQPDALKEFNYDGYRFNSDLSHGDTWVFTRDHA
ncbi:MAG TPA: peroxide stress protein YaaA [Marinobacterium sp.]|nr:peroxide stress protein YaaA [Marinobacterium sp.]